MSKRRNFSTKSKKVVNSDYKFVERPFYWEKCDKPTRIDELIFFRANKLITKSQYKSLKEIEADSYERFKLNKKLYDLVIYKRVYGTLSLIKLAKELKAFKSLYEAMDYVEHKLEFYYASKVQFLHYMSLADDLALLISSLPFTSYSAICESVRQKTNTYVLGRKHAKRLVKEIKDRMNILYPHLISIESGEEFDPALLGVRHAYSGITIKNNGIAFEYTDDSKNTMWDSFSFEEVINQRLYKYLNNPKNLHRKTEEEVYSEKIENEEEADLLDSLNRFELYLELKEEFKDWESDHKSTRKSR